MMLEEIVYASPATLAIYLSWVADGYARSAKKYALDGSSLHPFFGMVSMATCASPALVEKLPQGSSSKLQNAAHVMEGWIVHGPELTRHWKRAYWDAVVVGCQTGILALDGLRLKAGPKKVNPKTDGQSTDYAKAVTLGRMFGQEPSDAARWRQLARGLHRKAPINLLLEEQNELAN